MPTISAFYPILIRMFYNDHPPPHFHVRYGEFEATLDIASLSILEGDLRLCRQNAPPANLSSSTAFLSIGVR